MRAARPARVCACGCGVPLGRQARQFASVACRWRVWRRPEYQARIRAAQRQAIAARRRKAAVAAERFPDKATAYAMGYRVGFNTAYRWWKAKLDRLLVRRAS